MLRVLPRAALLRGPTGSLHTPFDGILATVSLWERPCVRDGAGAERLGACGLSAAGLPCSCSSRQRSVTSRFRGDVQAVLFHSGSCCEERCERQAPCPELTAAVTHCMPSPAGWVHPLTTRRCRRHPLPPAGCRLLWRSVWRRGAAAEAAAPRPAACGERNRAATGQPGAHSAGAHRAADIGRRQQRRHQHG